jgi:riboflavin kinase/FMN adenylyltransferase
VLLLSQLSHLPIPYRNKPAVLTVGVFDGLHKAHLHILNKVISFSQKYEKGISVVYTFKTHPLKVLNPEIAPPLLLPNIEKISLFRDLGVNVLINTGFTTKLAQSDPEYFVENHLLKYLNIKEIIVGHDHAFGKNSAGNAHLLKEIGKAKGFHVTEIPPLKYKQQTISSSLIRDLISEGEIRTADKLLTRPYHISGVVVSGRQVGRKMGFPTANIKTANELVPGNGVYAVLIRHKKRLYPAIMNIGTRPTFSGQTRSLEAHLLDFNENLYGKRLVVTFVEKIRDEKKFDTVPELIRQIKKDSLKARRILEKI